MEKFDRIAIDPKICLGQPTIGNMRITVSFVIKMLASTKSIEAVLQAYPELEAEDIEQALEYAAWAVSDRIGEKKAIALTDVRNRVFPKNPVSGGRVSLE